MKSSYRGLGSIDFYVAARSVLLVGRMKDEHIKMRTLRQFPEELAQVYESIERKEIKEMEERMAKLLYKIAVEIAQMNLFLTSQMELSKGEIYDLRRDALKMVNESHGFIDLKRSRNRAVLKKNVF